MQPTEQYRQYSSLVRRHERLIVTLCLRYGHRGDTPEDLAQEVRIGLWHYYRRLGGSLARWKESLWLYWRTRAILSRRSRRPAPDLVRLNDAMLDTIAADDDSAAALVNELAEGLPDDDRRLIDLLCQGYSYAEIARLDGISVEAVRQRRRRLVEKMRQQWELRIKN